ncbi:MAG: glycoside hydrolase family 2 protein, partial [Spirochaetes bacterium]|nr:glycoside hydrolase family 2 protein [Spirochaetota bacterium]
EREDIPPFGGQIDYLCYGGIYREVSLDVYQRLSVRNVQAVCRNPLDERKTLALSVHCCNSGPASPAEVSATLSKPDGTVVAMICKTVSLPEATSIVDLSLDEIEGLMLWSVDDPYLYKLDVSVQSGGLEDRFSLHYGFRSAEFRPEGFFLNGRRLQLRGLNRHQSWPYVGYAMPKRAQIKDADILKHQLHLNLVRTSHYPQSVHFLKRCDEIGLLVFEELPGWQHIGDETWKQIAIQNVQEMISRDWNHPSIIIWGVRINESADDDSFYERTNAVARQLDPTRSTGGVRYITNSHLLEDVYTMNDFIHSGGPEVLRDQQQVTGLDRRVPYLITEYNGHMYPTKKSDNEERQCEHVMRHLRVQNAAYADPWISGAIGWCAFDYNTHKDFGSGDRICYHGVMDMFRLPKFAAWVYSSQVDPAVEVVLQPVSWWARGERSIGGVFPLIVLTNCDSISLQFGDYEPISVTQRAEQLGDLPWPPFIIDESVISLEKIGAWGMKWEDATISAYLKGKVVKTVRLPKDPLPGTLVLSADDTMLSAGAKDVTRCVLAMLDQYGNPLPFCDAIVQVQVQGPARIQGPESIALKGGSTAFWVESSGAAGRIQVRVRSAGFPDQELMLTVR